MHQNYLNLEKIFILFTTTSRKESLIRFLATKFDLDLWIPSFYHKNDKGKDLKLNLFPHYYFMIGKYENCIFLEDFCKANKYSGMMFLRVSDHLAYLMPDEIEHIKEIEQKYNLEGINPFELDTLKVGDKVKLIKEPYLGINGTIKMIKNTMLKIEVVSNDNIYYVWISSDNVNKEN